ncbi:hypothetical protein G3O08_17875 [Cryomorpha ignava]|uniref:HD-CE domain-containing protein n=1 Tax=Cryomorpha ignava TaxID=101383 RepID=A0A7K3WV14_9FLAO|nr:hypothetical protein [Cryomorpha ignava]NEN25368.1 hypothetical protein [Cryomorpha ignava]
MDLAEQTLEEWFLERPLKNMPHSKHDYKSAYKTLVNYLDTEVHPSINAATLLIEAGNTDGKTGFLTDHGPDHVKTVINRISQLLKAERLKLTDYETYLLLLAVQFHDVGHVTGGRKNHEVNSKNVISEVAKMIGNDTAEQRVIWNIAEAHGGQPKDKISLLQRQQNILGQTIRTQLLAALLKFGDELSDDRSRAIRYRYLMEKDVIPVSSQVFHEYANALHSVMIDTTGQQIRLEYEILCAKALKTFGKGGEHVYLFDEIVQRVKKMHTERIYCMRFLAPYMQINQIYARVEFYSDSGFEEVFDAIDFKFQEEGYPDISHLSIPEVCPDLNKWCDQNESCGEKIKEQIESKNKNGNVEPI